MTDKRTFPGPVACGLMKEAECYCATTTVGSRIHVARREGALVEDYDGFMFIDFHCDASVNNLGGNHPVINEVIERQARSGNIFSEHHNAPNLAAVELSKMLVEKSPVRKPAKAYLANSGTEANETATKISMAARRKSQQYDKKKVIYFKNSFHGRTLGVIAGTNSKPEVQRDPFWDHCDQENVVYLPYPRRGTNFRLYEEYFKDMNPALIDRMFIELPCQGEGGIIPADDRSVQYLFEACRENDIFVVVDAIQCGMGRAGSLFGCERYSWLGLQPDMITLGKALGGGLPIGAVIFRAELDFKKKGMHSSTFGGGPMVARLGLAVIKEIEALISKGQVQKLEIALGAHLHQLQKKFPAIVFETRGIGAMWAHEIVDQETRDLIIRKAEELVETEEYGLRLLSAGKKAIRFMPPLTIGEEMQNRGFGLYEKVLSSL